MHKLRTILTAAFCLLGSLSAAVQSPCSTGDEVTYNNRDRFIFDVDGNQIDAYGAKIYWFENKYYLYGTSFSTGTSTGLNAYSSIDLANWKFEGVVSTIPGTRPHILYNALTKKYVLWGEQGSDGGYTVSTSPSPTSNFTQVGVAQLDPAYASFVAADATVYQSGDQAYLAWAALSFTDPNEGDLWPALYQTMHISPLTDDFLNTTLVSYNVTSSASDLIDHQTESPDIFMRDGIYYVVVSNTCGFCSGSLGVVYRSSSIQGPWERDIISAYSCGGQVEGVFAVTDSTTQQTNYIWSSTTTKGGPRVSFSGHIYQPLQFNEDGSVQDLDCSPNAEFEVPITLGQGENSTGLATESTDGTPLVAAYESVCDSGLYYRLYQTWTNSKTGTLESVSVNIAAGGQTDNFTINVFSFSTMEELVSPGYKWNLLGSKTFDPTTVGQTFKALAVPLNASVTEGDQLGFSIGEATDESLIIGNLIPWCHLEYEHADQSKVLLQQGSGQVSPRGLYGNISAVLPRSNRAIKFFTNVV